MIEILHRAGSEGRWVEICGGSRLYLENQRRTTGGASPHVMRRHRLSSAVRINCFPGPPETGRADA